MALFLSTFTNKVDKKGRVSVPASFRQTLAGQSFHGVIVIPSLTVNALECSGMDRMEDTMTRLDTLEPQSEQYRALISSFADVQQLAFDPEGRIVIPRDLLDEIGIDDTAAFVGQGATFEIWEPEAHKQYKARARELVREKGYSLPPRVPGNAK
ncbi:MAG TPA: division/cell wall cluster transcriptional repressor MraZ [Stellaceae bacterium]|nr:division/cell wall cluster transcriptional repressor MraZ [Stellaceae bacterium]